MYRIILIGFLSFLTTQGMTQTGGFAFGVKGGLSTGFQKWNGIDRDPLYKYHAIAYVESIAEDTPNGLFLQLGYHVRGSAIRNRPFATNLNGQIFRPRAREFRFNNISLATGFKSKRSIGNNSNAYYLLGLRGDYTLSTNFAEFDAYNAQYPGFSIYPYSEGVREWNYGVIIGGGMEWMLSDLLGGILELTINPDFSRQYEQPTIPNVIDPFTGNTRTLPERIVRNVTVELTAGIRLLRRVEYID